LKINSDVMRLSNWIIFGLILVSIILDMRDITSRYNYNANVNIVSKYGIDELSLFVTVNGTSMVPTLKNGQELTVLNTNNLCWRYCSCYTH